MSNHPRRYGRREPKRAAAISFARIFTGKTPDHPIAEDHLAALDGGWQMLGNDVAGVCASVTWANIRRLLTSLAGNEKYPTYAQVVELYRTQNPDFDPNGAADANGPGSSADGGMDLQTLLEYLSKHGGPDGAKVLAFARVDPSNVEEIKAAIAILGFVWTGIVVQEANQEEFEERKPWNYHRTSPDEGGHSVITGGYGPAGTGALGGDERFITWAEETSFTDTFWSRKVEECWAVIFPEHLTHPAVLEGIDLTTLAADYEAITGKKFPAVVPTPTPVPSPPPAPTPAPDPRLAEAAVAAQQLAKLMQPWAPGNGS